MTSPFPGMDPYIEASGLWEDFHTRLIGGIDAALSTFLPERYELRLGERNYVAIAESEEKVEHPFKPDLDIVSATPPQGTGKGTAVVEPAADADPVSMRAFIAEPFRESFIEIYTDEPERYLVTCIEVLSPSNKRRGSKGRKLYKRKRQGMLLGGTNFIEIDLLRRGRRMPMLDPWPESPYTLLVGRSALTPSCRVWPAHFQRRLPVIPVPLAHPDPDLALDLQPLIETIYARSRYARRIDYSKPLKPPLTAEETRWLAEQLRTRQTQP